jgi:hypothetical protein
MRMRHPSFWLNVVVIVTVGSNVWSVAHGWIARGRPIRSTTTTCLSVDRRAWLSQNLGTLIVTVPVVAVATGHPNKATAASTTAASSNQELERLQLGHARVRYLLDHWDEVTSVCGTTIMSDLERRQVVRTEGGGGGQCSKTPLRVQDYMGYKSINDPLYRVDKLMVRASGSLPDPNDVEGYLDAVERYRETADATALLAYTSSWGESNPYV